MILVYCHETTNRITYAVGLLLKTILEMDWQITNDLKYFSSYQGARICYGDDRLLSDALYVQPAGLLSEKGVRHFVPDCIEKDGLTLLFPTTRAHCDLGFDPFSAAFYLTSRYEEYLPFLQDRFGRFEASESLAYKVGFLKTPLVDHYAMLLKRRLSDTFPFLMFPARSFRLIPTIDVDVAYAYRGRGLFRTLYGAMSSLISGDISALKQRFRVLAGKERDPFDSYDLQINLHNKYGLEARYFFLSGNHGTYDRSISYASKAFRKLVEKIDNHAVVGVHPSFASNHREGLMRKEINRLSTLINRQPSHSRQHYLKLFLPRTYRRLIQNNISHDYSMGFASQPGFRAATCTPYYFYDLQADVATNLKVYPLTVMDGTLRDYMKLSPEEAIPVIKELISEVKKVDGTFISLWHNDALGENKDWQGWLWVYEQLLMMAST